MLDPLAAARKWRLAVEAVAGLVERPVPLAARIAHPCKGAVREGEFEAARLPGLELSAEDLDQDRCSFTKNP